MSNAFTMYSYEGALTNSNKKEEQGHLLTAFVETVGHHHLSEVLFSEGSSFFRQNRLVDGE